MDKKLVPCGLFLDFSKAFDTINHILLSKLLLSLQAPLVVRNYIHVQGSLLYCYSNEPF